MTRREPSRRRWGRVLLAALWAWGAGAPLPAPAWAQRRRAESAAPLPAPEEAQEPLPASARPLPSIQIGAASSGPSGPPSVANPLETRVTVRVKDAPLATFLDTISAQARVNFIITEGLEKKRVTAFLQTVTVREALQILLEMKGLTYQQIGRSNTYVVSPRSRTAPVRITRIYTLNHISLIPIAQPGGAASSSPSGGMKAAPASPAPSQGQAGQGGAGAPASGPAIAILDILRGVLSRNGEVSTDPRTNALVVTDIPEVFPQVEQIIAELDKKAPQVMIEAQIVEINSDKSQQLGLEWGGTNGELAAFVGGSRETTFPLDLPVNLKGAQFLTPGGTIKNSVLDLTQLKVTLRALVSRSEAKFLGKPKVMTVNNKKATIKVAQDQAVALQNQQTSVGTSGSTSTTAPERRETGLKLDVTPQVNKEGYITLLVEPSFTNVVEARISTPSNRIFDPVERSASSLVRVRNGQTLVLGGLLSSNETKVVRKVPILGYIPIVGWFFTSSATERSNTDLVIFITPTIVND